MSEYQLPIRHIDKRVAKYGITGGDYARMVEHQQSRCAICASELPPMSLVVDHDHDTGLVRGLLCGTCNAGIGYFFDNAASLRAAADYLERTGSTPKLPKPRKPKSAGRREQSPLKAPTPRHCFTLGCREQALADNRCRLCADSEAKRGTWPSLDAISRRSYRACATQGCEDPVGSGDVFPHCVHCHAWRGKNGGAQVPATVIDGRKRMRSRRQRMHLASTGK